MFKFTLAQINPTIGDIEGNLALMKQVAHRAHAAGAALVVFPEMSLTAYYPSDLLDDPEFLKRVAKGLEALLAASRDLPDLYWVIGAPTPHIGSGKRLYNSLIVIKKIRQTCAGFVRK